jgi:radical SAM protein with 4Fe4S-binding SPASM domain
VRFGFDGHINPYVLASPIMSLSERLMQCQSLDDFYDLCAPLGLYSRDRRFLHLEMDIVNRCNIRCVMCFHSFESTRRERTVHLSPDDFAFVAARVLPHAYHLSLSLGNEPLMSPHFVEILRLASGYKIPNVNFFTNGLLLNDKNIEAIIEYGVTQLCISIDGATPATYNAIRRDGDFDHLIRNVKRFIARRDALRSATPRVRFDFVLMKRNIHELPDLVKLAAELGVQQLAFRHLVSFEGLNMEQESLQLEKALSDQCLGAALKTAATLGLEVQTRPEFFKPKSRLRFLKATLLHASHLLPRGRGTASDTPEADSRTPFVPTPYCPFPFFHISMGPGGHILPCPHAHGEAPYGQVSAETPIDQIWLNSKFMALRRRILQHDPPDMCRRCPYLADKYPNIAELFASRTQPCRPVHEMTG